MFTRRHALVMATAATLVLSGCGGGTPTQGDTAPSGQQSAATDYTGTTFTIWQYEVEGSAQYVGWQKALEIFKAEHPGLEVNYVTTSFTNIQQNAKLLLTGNNVPDVMEVNKGNANAGQLASQGLLLDLSEQVEKYGWDEIVTGAMSALARYDESGRANAGNWYGIPNIGQFGAIYYNKDMFAEAGITSPPETMAELESIMDMFVSKGITPISSSASSAQGFGALWAWYSLVSAKADRQLIDDYIFLTNEVDLTSGAFLDGTREFEKWIQRGYLGSQLAGVDNSRMQADFIAGKYPMLVDLSNTYSLIDGNAEFEFGAFTFPEAKMVNGSSGHLWSVPTDSKQKQLAYEWIDTTLSPEVQNAIGVAGGIPLAGDPSVIQDDGIKALNEDFQVILERDNITFAPDYPAPGFLDVVQSSMQSMVNGSATAEEMLAQLQEKYDEGREQVLNG